MRACVYFAFNLFTENAAIQLQDYFDWPRNSTSREDHCIAVMLQEMIKQNSMPWCWGYPVKLQDEWNTSQVCQKVSKGCEQASVRFNDS